MRHLQKLFKMQTSQVIGNRAFLQNRQQEELQKIAQILEEAAFETDDPTAILNAKLRDLESASEKKQAMVLPTYLARLKKVNFQAEYQALADISASRIIASDSSSNQSRVLRRGIPFTVKDHLKVEGLIETCGFSHNVKPSTESCEVVRLLEKQGCVAYAHTNVPQGLLGIQSSNNVYGCSRNPFNSAFISGGSSGGQGASVAAQVSAFGLGSDSAGSVRMPAAFCGIYGFKPTGSKRLSIKGRVGVTGNEGPGMPGLDTSLGFLAKCADDIAWLCEKTLGKSLTPNPYLGSEWNAQAYQKACSSKKRFGLLICEAEMELAPSVRNVLMQTVELLRNDGHQVVEFDFPEILTLRDLFFQLINSVGFLNAMRNRMIGQNPVPIKEFEMSHLSNSYLGVMLKKYQSTSSSERNRYAIHYANCSTAELMGLLSQKEVLQEKFLKKIDDLELDLLISPTMPFTAPLFGSTKHLVHQLKFCAYQNLFELPAGHVPVRRVQKSETKYSDKSFYGREATESIQRSEGLPVGVQITGKHLQDQVCLGAMHQLEKLISKELDLPKL